ncbi:MAG: PTS sugar transporter subunit IIA [Verrucomicrobiota bacterium]|nr:PTS sugar transporter subunit IIA [Verrucomicrobiota bacterium]
MAVVLGDLLHEQQVKLELAARTRDEALREIVGLLPANVERDKLLVEMIAREHLHTTYIGHGVALPHARTELVPDIMLAIGRSREGVTFGEKSERAHLIFAIGVPRRMVTDYLVCVGGLARLASDEKTRQAMMAAETPSDFVTLLRKASLVLE